MPSSRDSSGFIRQLDRIKVDINEVIEAALWSRYQPGDATPDANAELSWLLVSWGVHLLAKKGSLSNTQLNFLSELMSGAEEETIVMPSAALSTTLKRSFEQNPQIYQIVPLELFFDLRSYDAVNGTACAKKLGDHLQNVIAAMLSMEQTLQPKDQLILDQIKVALNEVYEYARSPQNCLNPNSPALIAEINSAISSFLKPLRLIADEFQMEGMENIDSYMRTTLWCFVRNLILIDNKVDPKELEGLADLSPTFGHFGYAASLAGIKFQQDAVPFEKLDPTCPGPVVLLQIYDNHFGTEHAERARALFFRLANYLFKADSVISHEEAQWLSVFKDSLYERESASANTVDTVSGINSVYLPEMTDKLSDTVDPSFTPTSSLASFSKGLPDLENLHAKLPAPIMHQPMRLTPEEALEELKSLSGLHAVKAELNSLVNTVKVNEMRQQRGMPINPPPRGFAFAGGPGVGKRSTARILANLYRGLDLLQLGQLYELEISKFTAPELNTLLETDELTRHISEGVLYLDEPFVSKNASQQEIASFLERLLGKLDAAQEPFVLIMAGQSSDIHQFLELNQTLSSRFEKSLFFDNPSSDDLITMLDSICQNASFVLSPDARDCVKVVIETSFKSTVVPNARTVKQLFEQITTNQANRIVTLSKIDDEILSTIILEDIEPVLMSLMKV